MPQDVWLPSAVRRADGSVFHYTSAHGLLGIVKYGQVWASEASSLNDLAEVRQGWETISRLLKGFDESEGRQLLALLAKDPLKASHEVFVLSASTAGDDANQWRLYADAGKGYALELDGTVQLTVHTSVSADPPPDPTRRRWGIGQRAGDATTVTPWLHVFYTEDEVESALDELLAKVEGEISDLARASDKDQQQFLAESLRDDAHEALATIAHLIKTPGFSGENEVRVVATFAIRGDHVCYRAGANGLIGYATLTQAPDGRGTSVLRPSEDTTPVLPLKSVRIGPLLAKEQKNTLRGFLRLHHLSDIKIRRSKVPLR